MYIARGGGGSNIPFHKALIFFLLLIAVPSAVGDVAQAENRNFKLRAPADLIESGLPRFFIPRFSLKHSIRIELVDDGAAAANLNSEGRGDLVFSGPMGNWYLELSDTGIAENSTRLFADWLTGSVGQKTIASYVVDGNQPFLPAANSKAEEADLQISGDVVLGEKLSERHCGRCHMVNEKTRLTTIGSTPSFGLLRAFPDWNNRFEAFYALRPHPAFTIVEEVTEPFDETRPSPIAPMRVTLEDIEAIMAYVSTIKPADLGSPLKLQ